MIETLTITFNGVSQSQHMGMYFQSAISVSADEWIVLAYRQLDGDRGTFVTWSGHPGNWNAGDYFEVIGDNYYEARSAAKRSMARRAGILPDES